MGEGQGKMKALEEVMHSAKQMVSAFQDYYPPIWSRNAYKIISKADAELAEIKQLLKSYEWIRDGECPECQGDVTDGHKPNCKLEEILREKDKP